MVLFFNWVLNLYDIVNRPFLLYKLCSIQILKPNVNHSVHFELREKIEHLKIDL